MTEQKRLIIFGIHKTSVAQPRQRRDAQIGSDSRCLSSDLALAERVAVIPQLRDVGSSSIKKFFKIVIKNSGVAQLAERVAVNH